MVRTNGFLCSPTVSMTTPWYHLNHANGILVAIHPRILCPGGRSNIARLTIFLPMMSPYITIEMRMKYPMNAVMKYILSSTYVVLPKWKLVRAMILIAILSAPPNSSKIPAEQRNNNYNNRTHDHWRDQSDINVATDESNYKHNKRHRYCNVCRRFPVPDRNAT